MTPNMTEDQVEQLRKGFEDNNGKSEEVNKGNDFLNLPSRKEKFKKTKQKNKVKGRRIRFPIIQILLFLFLLLVTLVITYPEWIGKLNL